MRLHFPPGGPPELVREDGWFYRLHGLGQMEMTVEFDRAFLDVAIYDLSDRTLEAIRVLRDAFEYPVRLHHDY